MRISDVHIDGFGVWHDLTIGQLSPEVTAFYGPNEAGKTTLMQFMRSVLYGVSAERRRRYLPPLAGGRPGGWLRVDGDDGAMQIKRVADRGPSDVGKVTVITSDGEEHGDRLLREALEHVDEATFNNVFAVGLRDIQELGSLSGTAAAQWLYRLTSGLDRVSLYDVIHLLRGSLVRLLNEPDETSEIRDLLARREALEGELEELITKGRRWAQSAVKLGELADEIVRLQDESKRLAAEGRRLETAINLRPLWTKRLHVDETIASLGELHPLPENADSELDELNNRIEEHERQREILKAQRHQLRQEAESLDINEMLQVNLERLIALEEQQEWLVALEREAEEADAKVQQLEARLTSEHDRLVERWLEEGASAERVTLEIIDQLEPQAKAISATHQMVERAQADLASRQNSELEYRTKLESTAASADKLGLPADIQQASDLVSQLRQRVQVEQRIEKGKRELRDLEQQNYELVEGQLLPLKWFTFLLAVFALSSASLGASWMDWIDKETTLGTLAGWMGLAGAVGVPIAVFWKFVRERLAADRLEEWYFQMEDVEQDIQDAKKEQKRLSQQSPLAEGSVKLRLQQAERHLSELEKSLPVESQRRAVQQEIEALQQRLKQAELKHEAALQNWRSKLRTLGMAEDIHPTDLDAIVRQYDELDRLRERVASSREELQQRRRELATLDGRIHRLAVETDLQLSEATPLEQLLHMLEVHREQKARLSHRDGLRERAKELKGEEARHARAAVGLARQREVLFGRCGVTDESGFRQLLDKHAEVASLQQKRKGLSREIAAAVGQRSTEEDFAGLMLPEVMGRLEHEWETVTGRVEEIEGKLKRLLEERGRLVEQQRRLADDRSLGHKQLEIDELDQQILRAKQAWRQRAVVYLMLERIRDEYERNRQPETLLEASQYLRQLTSGRYQRIWTPLANDVLLVEQADGESLPVEVLSTGTREQLFVSLRLAIVAMFARRGIQLPMILDDVFVNFDIGRTRIAVQVLVEFASQGHQLLVFTCHEHVWRMFQEIQADVRRLPDRFGDRVEEEVWCEAPEPQLEPELELPAPEAPPAVVAAPPPPQPEPKPKRKTASIPPPVVERRPTAPDTLPDYVYAEPEPVLGPLPEYEYSLESEQSRPDAVEVEYRWPPHDDEGAWEPLGDAPQRPLPDPIVEPVGMPLQPAGMSDDHDSLRDQFR